MDLGIEGRVALVSGGGGGLGGAIALSLAREGARVAVCDRDLAAAQAVVEVIVAAGGSAAALAMDLAAPDSLNGVVDRIDSTFGPVDILVNNSGGPPHGPALGLSPTQWRAQFETMVLSLIQLSDRVVPGMRSRGWGRVITSASSGIVAPIDNLALSNALRMTLLGWSKTLAHEVGADGVTVNVVIPGRIGTERIAFLDRQRALREGRTQAEVQDDSLRAIPLRRYGRPAEYADAVAFLSSDRASFITGSVLRVDGGMIASV